MIPAATARLFEGDPNVALFNSPSSGSHGVAGLLDW